VRQADFLILGGCWWRPVSVCSVRPSRDGSTCFGKGVMWKRPAHLRSKRLCTSRGTTLIAEALLRDRANAHGNAAQ
jgi:hypothetical protein